MGENVLPVKFRRRAYIIEREACFQVNSKMNFGRNAESNIKTVSLSYNLGCREI
jgi:hypothetical protein